MNTGVAKQSDTNDLKIDSKYIIRPIIWEYEQLNKIKLCLKFIKILFVLVYPIKETLLNKTIQEKVWPPLTF